MDSRTSWGKFLQVPSPEAGWFCVGKPKRYVLETQLKNSALWTSDPEITSGGSVLWKGCFSQKSEWSILDSLAINHDKKIQYISSWTF